MDTDVNFELKQVDIGEREARNSSSEYRRKDHDRSYLAYDQFSDYAFLPGRDTDEPAMIIELKYDKDADTAIRQIHEDRYQGDFKKYYGDQLLVGINYDKDAKGSNAKRHSCSVLYAMKMRRRLS